MAYIHARPKIGQDQEFGCRQGVWRSSGRRMRQRAGNESLKVFRHIRLERSRFLLFLSQSADVADVPSVDMLPCLMQRLLFAVYILEHLVSEIPCQGLVYALCQRTGIPLATVFLLSGRRMVQGHTPA